MKLRDYIQHHGLSVRGFARKADVCHVKITRIIKGGKITLDDDVAKICKATRGDVQPNSFINWEDHGMKIDRHARFTFNENEEK